MECSDRSIGSIAQRMGAVRNRAVFVARDRQTASRVFVCIIYFTDVPMGVYFPMGNWHRRPRGKPAATESRYPAFLVLQNVGGIYTVLPGHIFFLSV